MGWRNWVWSGSNAGRNAETKQCDEEQRGSASATVAGPLASNGPIPAAPMASEDLPFEINIIDESGNGFGFDLDPATVAKPLAITSGVLFSLGALAGVPMGVAMGRSTEEKSKVKPTVGGALFAARAFLYGTLLCGAFGAVSMYATARYYDVWAWEEFGDVMRDVVPRKRDEIETTVAPLLASVREGATEGLPGPTEKAKDWFGESRVGIYIRGQIEEATTLEYDDERAK